MPFFPDIPEYDIYFIKDLGNGRYHLKSESGAKPQVSLSNASASEIVGWICYLTKENTKRRNEGKGGISLAYLEELGQEIEL